MEEIFSLVQDVVALYKKVRADIEELPGQMNLLDLTVTSHLENKNSDILAFLLAPHSPHHHKEFGEKFLFSIKQKCISSTSNRIIAIEREKCTDKNRRIDLFIETVEEVIIIENKIYANDLDDQLDHYIKWATSEYFNKKIFVLYLTLDGSDPSEISLSQENRKALIQDGRYSNLTYENDILPWLGDLIEIVDKKREKELYSALEQYRDSIKGLCRLKEDDQMEDKSFAEALFNKYGNMNREDLSEVIDSIELTRNQICFTTVVNFIRELHVLLSPSNTLFYTHRQKRYCNEGDWLEKVLHDRSWVGLEVALEQSNSEFFGLAIEFSRMDQRTSVAYGVMSHGKSDTTSKEPPFSGNILSKWEEDKFLVKQNPYWWKVIDLEKWVTSALFRNGTHSNWEKNNNLKLVDHIHTSWFIRDLEYYKSQF
jgi:hypothetical protein